ncbi:hypothetical protein MNBD_GAMMA09-3441 [hydrothermal vent metagenome]|uniref:Uncharacterized protein n=1 Tax=hydrothermal vent metagenome TaxID=652676 RepID=A0A3B0XD13_9ZZZZ
MALRGKLKLEQVTEPVKHNSSRFVSQPGRIEKPGWPLDKADNEKMYFIGQIELTENLFGKTQGKIACIFMSSRDDADLTWDADAGQNIIIIQPDNNTIPAVADGTGPTGDFDEDGICEFTLTITPGNESDYIPEKKLNGLMESDQEQHDNYLQEMETSKIGGCPMFIQSAQTPIEDDWKLLFQLGEEDIPVEVNFGCGIAYALIQTGLMGKCYGSADKSCTLSLV